MSWDYLQQKSRINEEIVTAIHTAGGNVSSFDINAITEFIFAAQCNNIQIYRDGIFGAYHVSYTKPQIETKGEIKCADQRTA